MRAVLLLAAWAWSAPAMRQDTVIQIGIAQKVAAVTLAPAGKFLLIDASDGRRGELESERSYKLSAHGSGLKLGELLLTKEARLKPLEAQATLKVGAQRYRGDFLLRMEPEGGVTVVEEIGIEEYLTGVLPHEMDSDWPVEALKAQAVVARTFAYAHLDKFRGEGFDLSTDTRSQVYRGMGYDSERVQRAVRETRGEVLGWKGELLTVFYHACCGGHTTSPNSVWGSKDPPPAPLRGVRDRWCARSPHARWEAYFSRESVAAAAQEGRLIGTDLKSLKIAERDKAGYARSFWLRIGDDDLLVSANDLRRRLGASELRGVRLSGIKLRKKGVEFRGSGSGHGVGLCQWGARLQAEKGRRYEDVLKFYFPGATLSVVDR